MTAQQSIVAAASRRCQLPPPGSIVRRRCCGPAEPARSSTGEGFQSLLKPFVARPDAIGGVAVLIADTEANCRHQVLAGLSTAAHEFVGPAAPWLEARLFNYLPATDDE